MNQTCPTELQLHSLLHGEMNQAEEDTLCDHVDSCSTCEQAIARIEASQSQEMISLCESYQSNRYLNEPEYQQLRSQLLTANPESTELAKYKEEQLTEPHIRDYKIISKLGQGGMGKVYHAVHIHLGKSVALKVLPNDKLNSKQSIERFKQEIRAVGKLNHPNVVSATDAGSSDGRYYLVMELIHGVDLKRLLQSQGPLNLPDACEIVRLAALGIQHAHDNHLIHRDVKPSNLMLTQEGIVKLLDLGLAGINSNEALEHHSSSVDPKLTQAGQVMGTLHFMSPEQFTSINQIDERVDIYSLGCTLFYLLTDRYPHDLSGSNGPVIKRVMCEASVDIRTIRNDIPQSLYELMNSLLAKSPQDRPQTAGEVADRLGEHCKDSNLKSLMETSGINYDLSQTSVDLKDISFFIKESELEKPDRKNKDWSSFKMQSLLFIGIVLIGVISCWGFSIWFQVHQAVDDQQTVEIILDANDPVSLFKNGKILLAAKKAEQLSQDQPEHGWYHAQAAIMWSFSDHSIKLINPKYQQHRDWLAKRWQETTEGTNTIPRVCSLVGNGPENGQNMLNVIEREELKHRKDWRYPHSRMMLLYRMQRYEEAFKAFEDCRKISPNNRLHKGTDHAWASMILFNLKRAKEAKQHYNEANKIQLQFVPKGKIPVPETWFDYAELIIVMREAKEMVQ